MTIYSDGDGGTPSHFVQAANLWYDICDTYTVRFVVDGCRKNLPLCDLSDLESNPYQTPTNNNAVDAATSSPRHSPVRFWLYCHLAALCVTGVFSLVDSRIIQLPNASIDVIQWLIFPSLAALFVCPIAILVCILRPTVIPSQRLAIVVLETIVVLAHLFALLPAVQ